MRMISPVERQQFYQKCVQQVLGHISDRLGEEHELKDIADMAGFSPFHFHRMFKNVTGENLFECIRRLRLEAAATYLMTDRDITIVNVALKLGFNSQPAFARAFHAHFGMSASQWRDGEFWWHNGYFWDWRYADERRRRQRRGEGRVAGAGRMYYFDNVLADAADGKQPACLRRLEVKTLSPCRMAYQRLHGIATHDDFGRFWARFKHWAQSQQLMTPDSILISRSSDNPHVVAPQYLRHEIGLVVGPDFVPSPDIAVQEVPGGRYLVADFNGPVYENPVAWEYVWQHWMPLHGWQQDLYTPVHGRVRAADSVISDTDDRYQLCIPVRSTRTSTLE